MAGIAIIGIIVGIIIVSIGIGTYMYLEYQPNFIFVNSGEPVRVGPVQYIITPVGEHKGNEDMKPNETFFQIQIIAENLADEPTRMTGGQFHIMDETDVKFQPIYGDFSEMDLLTVRLEPNRPQTWLTQFDIPYDEDKTYRIGILPTKVQSSRDIGIVCIQNC